MIASLFSSMEHRVAKYKAVIVRALGVIGRNLLDRADSYVGCDRNSMTHTLRYARRASTNASILGMFSWPCCDVSETCGVIT